jgi:hypothetical protein
MHSVLKDEWTDADPQKCDRVGAMYHGKRSGDNFDYHMWTVKVNRTDATATDAAAEETEEDDTRTGAPDFNKDDFHKRRPRQRDV